MAARKQANQNSVDHFLLSDDNLADLRTDFFHPRAGYLKSTIWLHWSSIVAQPVKPSVVNSGRFQPHSTPAPGP